LALASFEPAIRLASQLAMMIAFMWKSTALVNFDNAVATEAIAKVSQAVLRNPCAAKQAVVTAIAAISLATLESFWALKVAQANAAAGKPAVNLTGSNTPIEFKLGRQGIPLISTSLSRRLSLDAKATAGESERVKVDAGTKHRPSGKQWTLGRNFGEQFLRKSTKRWQKGA